MSRPFVVLLLLLGGCGPKEAPPVAAASISPTPAELSAVTAPFPPDAAIPHDPLVRSGLLDNGLRWFIEENDKPEERAELRLVVRAGSVQEDDDQLGLAHFVEHMAFNGSENFEGNALIAAMEAMGMDFGAHVNAYTSFDRTVYTLTVPTDDPALIETALLVLRDQAGGLLLEGEEIEKERGVVLEEWRSRQGAGSRISEVMVKSTYGGSIYADRLPIGTKDSLETFEHEALERFYADWYRPELMAVIAVGDFDADRIEGLIAGTFADLANPDQPRELGDLSIPPRSTPTITIVTDPEVPRSSISISDQVDGREKDSYSGYVDLLVRNLYFAVLNERLGTLAQSPEAPFLGAGGGWNRLNAEEESWSFGVGLREGLELDGLRAALAEVERLRRHGVTQAELDRAKAGTLSFYERIYQEREKTSSSTHAEELVRVFTTGETMPGTTAEHGFAGAWLPRIGKARIDAFAADWLQRGSTVVQVVMPDKEGLAVLTEAELLEVFAEVEALEVEATEDEAIDGPLLAELPPEEGATVVSRGTIEGFEEMGVVTWVLSNGAEVVLLPTTFQDDQILLRATSQGGRSLVTDDQYVPAATAMALRGRSGLGDFDSPSLQKRLRGSRASASVGIGRFNESVSGSAAPDEPETMLQLVTLNFTAPRFDEDALIRYRRDRTESLRNRLSDPGAIYGDAYDALMWAPGIRTDPWTEETLESLDLTASKAFYESRFANAADFRWMLVGNLDPDAIEPLVVRYLGNLPADPEAEAETWQDDGIRRLDGQQEEVVYAGLEPRAQVKLTWHGPFESSWVRRNRLQAMEDLLSVRLRGVMREDLGGVYGVGVGSNSWERPDAGYSLTISFSCDPERVDELVQAALDGVEDMRSELVSDEEIATEQEKNRRDREESVRSNGFWLGAILGTLDRGEDPKDLLGWDARNDSLNAAEVQAMAQEVFASDANYVKVVLLPEDRAEGDEAQE